MLRWVLKILLILSVLHHFEMAKRLKISANTQRRFSFHHRRNFRTNRNEVELVPMDIDWEFANEMVLPLNRYLDSQVRTTISPSPYSTDLDPWESFCSPEWKKILFRWFWSSSGRIPDVFQTVRKKTGLVYMSTFKETERILKNFREKIRLF